VTSAATERDAMTWIPGGEFTMGSDRGYPEEGPPHRVTVSGFWIDTYAVTNAEFATFVEATGYVTAAERAPRPEDYPGVDPALLLAGSAVFRMPPGPVSLDEPNQWWAYVPGACWRHPEGPGSSIAGREQHPVVHIAYEDACAYADWAGKDLPTEAEWEFAARGGLEGNEFAWGDEVPGEPWEHANTWHGEFPWDNRKPHAPGTKPVGSYPPNGFGLYDMIGNVWEWTSDYWAPHHVASTCCDPHNPRGPAEPLAEAAAPGIPLRVVKGGSFLCAANYCARYRPAARIPQASDSATNHTGFRCVRRP
jgi:formylglycine-generating enzyme required for sulfatase activity